MRKTGGDRAYESNTTVFKDREGLKYGSKVSRRWFLDYDQSVRYKSKNSRISCVFASEDFPDCEPYRKELLAFLNMYRFVRREEVSELQKILSVCTKTAYFDTVDFINRFQLLWELKGKGGLPQLAKGNPFFERRFFWSVKYTWLFRRILEFRLKTFTVSGISQFWESLCKRYCKQQNGKIMANQFLTNDESSIFKPQGLESNLIPLFFMVLILLSVSSMWFLIELYLKLCLD
jgi:hypothetical protein